MSVRLTYRDGFKNHATQGNAKDGIIQVSEIIEKSDYYPFGLKEGGDDLPDYSAINKYKYAYGGKELNDELGLDLYDFGARNYDAAIGRWLNVDPLAEQTMEPYQYVSNNPINIIDPTGMYGERWEGGGYGDRDGVDNDITVNSKGIITNVVYNDKPHRVFDESGKQLSLNDYNFDSHWLSSKNEGDRLYYPIDESSFVQMIDNAGVSMRGGIFGMYGIAAKSYYGADFAVNQLAPKFGIDLMDTEYAGKNESDGAFFRFGNQKSLYNLADAGNFMWGSWMRASSFSLFEAKSGAHLNNFFFGVGVSDSPEDQRAIKNGYNYLNNLINAWKKSK